MEYIRINENCKARAKVGEILRIEYETDAIKDQNSTFRTSKQKLSLCFQYFNDFGIIYLHRKRKKPRIEIVVQARQKKANEDIYNLMISQQNTIEVG
jgi:hypothetical protein